MSNGAVMMPAPTPIIAISAAIPKPGKTSMTNLELRSLQVDAAFEFAAGPAPGTRVIGIERQTRTRRAAYACVSLLIERQERNTVLFGVVPDVASGPFGERAQLCESLAGGQRERFFGLKIGARL